MTSAQATTLQDKITAYQALQGTRDLTPSEKMALFQIQRTLATVPIEPDE